MFDASLCPANLLVEITDARRRLIDSQVEELRRLFHARDFELLFVDGNYCRPNWDLVVVLGTNVGIIIREIFDLSHDVAHAEDELELRARPN